MPVYPQRTVLPSPGRSWGCTVIWATRRLGDRRLGDKFFPKWTFGRHEIGRLGDKDETFGRQLNL